MSHLRKVSFIACKSKIRTIERSHDSTIARWNEMYKDFHNFHWFGFMYIVINTDICPFRAFAPSCFLAFMVFGAYSIIMTN